MPRYVDADALISECEEEIVDYDEDLQKHFTVKAVPTEYIENFPAAYEWISVKERLPEEWKPVLAAVVIAEVPKNPIIDTMVYIGNMGGRDNWRVCWNHDKLKSEVTHWMPLPDPPEVEE